MAYENLICPNCACPLSASQSQFQIACPRCFTWLELESKCNGVCLSCHAAKQTVNTDCCTCLADEVEITIEMSSAKRDPSPELAKTNRENVFKGSV